MDTLETLHFYSMVTCLMNEHKTNILRLCLNKCIQTNIQTNNSLHDYNLTL